MVTTVFFVLITGVRFYVLFETTIRLTISVVKTSSWNINCARSDLHHQLAQSLITFAVLNKVELSTFKDAMSDFWPQTLTNRLF